MKNKGRGVEFVARLRCIDGFTVQLEVPQKYERDCLWSKEEDSLGPFWEKKIIICHAILGDRNGSCINLEGC